MEPYGALQKSYLRLRLLKLVIGFPPCPNVPGQASDVQNDGCVQAEMCKESDLTFNALGS